MTNRYRIAGRTVGITSLYEDVHRLCAAYRTDDANAVLSVIITREDIEYERARSAQEDEAAGRPVRQFSDGYLETLAVYRSIAEKMPAFDTLLFHGSCVAADGVGYCFAAVSGTGKSTHTRLWREMLGERAVMINDDKPLIRITDNGAIAYGTPWDGKHRLSTNAAAPLKAICLLERAKENTIRPVSVCDVYSMLLQQIYRPRDGESMSRTLALFDRLLSSVSLWRLGCNMKPEAARVAYEAMKGESR